MKTVEKPWGREIWWAVTDKYVGKVLQVRAGHSLSLQYHRRKLESMYFRRGEGTLLLGEERLAIREGLSVTVPPGVVHKIIADSDLEIFEVSTPELDDVVRLQDEYGRAAAEPAAPRPAVHTGGPATTT